MKSLTAEQPEAAAVPELIAATEQAMPHQANALARARAFAEPFIAGETLDTGENTLAHADAVAAILKSMGGSEAMQAASYLVYACPHLNKPQEVIAKAFGENYAALALETNKLVRDPAADARGRGRGPAGGRRQGADRERAQDAAGVLARPAGGDAAPGVAAADAALARVAQDRRAAQRGARSAERVRAAGQPAGHLAAQVGNGGPGVPLPRAGHLQEGGAVCWTRSGPSARNTSSSCARGCRRS